MRKIISLLAGVIIFTSAGAQSIEEIVKLHVKAAKTDQLAKIKTIKITGKMTAMGMEMPLEMYMKNPDKIKVIYSFGGQQMISVFDGEKGYIQNPMTGSMSPVELKGDQLSQLTRNNIFTNEVLNSFNQKRLVYEKEEMVSGKPAYRLKVNIEGTDSPSYLFIDKATGLLVKVTTTVEQMGTTMNVETFLTGYKEHQGLVMPMKTTAMANGMEAAVISFSNVEVNIPVDESVFKLK